MFDELLKVIKVVEPEIGLAVLLESQTRLAFSFRILHYRLKRRRGGLFSQIAQEAYAKYGVEKFLSYRTFSRVLLIPPATTLGKFNNIRLPNISEEEIQLVELWLKHQGYKYNIEYDQGLEESSYTVRIFLRDEEEEEVVQDA